jgi:ABC-type phosphate/phosphonate transport system substrate-binding protein
LGDRRATGDSEAMQFSSCYWIRRSAVKTPTLTNGAKYLLLCLTLLPWNAEATEAQAAVRPQNTDAVFAGNPLIFSAPPRGTLAKETENYQPLTDFLTKVTGRTVIYQHADNWLSYSRDMTQGKLDIVFDGPHFNGWRMENLNHTPLVKLPEDFIFVVIVKADNKSVQDIKQLAGRRICAHAPPNLGTLTMLKQFDNPARQPVIATVKGWDKSYASLMAGQCVATVVPIKNLEKMDKGKNLARIVYKSPAMPNQAISAGPRISREIQDKIKQALLTEEGKAATAKLRSAYAGKDFVPATRAEYVGLSAYIKNSLYYSNPAATGDAVALK